MRYVQCMSEVCDMGFVERMSYRLRCAKYMPIEPCINQKRPTKETYKKILQKNLEKRPRKETNKRDLQKSLTKETYKTGLQTI